MTTTYTLDGYINHPDESRDMDPDQLCPCCGCYGGEHHDDCHNAPPSEELIEAMLAEMAGEQ
jgi:hypothetical protein